MAGEEAARIAVRMLPELPPRGTAISLKNMIAVLATNPLPGQLAAKLHTCMMLGRVDHDYTTAAGGDEHE